MSLKEPLKAGIAGAVLGFVISSLANYFIIPIPVDTPGHAINNGISGAFSGFMGGFPGVWLYMFLQRKKSATAQKEPDCENEMGI
jgi:hypothetical protein